MKNTVTLPKSLTVMSLVVVTFWGFYHARPFLIPIGLAAFLAFMMLPGLRFMRKYRFPEWAAILVSSCLLLFPFFGLVSLLIWQGQALVRDFPTIVKSIQATLNSGLQSEWGQKLHLGSELDMSALSQQFEGRAIQSIQMILTGLGAILNAGSLIALVLLFSVLMLVYRVHLRKTSERILMQSFAVQNPKILDEVVSMIEKFLAARILIFLLVAGIDSLILYIFKVRYPVLLGSFLGLMTWIPGIGFLIGLVPPILVSFATFQGFWITFGVSSALLVVSMIEGNILTPKMVGSRLNINALATFVGLFGGGLLWGVWGMFLSIPILGILRITLTAAPSLRPWGDLLAEKSQEDDVSSSSSQNTKVGNLSNSVLR